MDTKVEAQASIEIDAPPEKVWGLVSDVTRMGEWSPECSGGRWKRGSSGAVVGAKFKGRNRRGIRRWSTDAKIVEATPGKEIAWTTSIMGLQSSRWGYHIEPRGEGGSTVTETWSYHGSKFLTKVGTLVTGVGDRPSYNEAGMKQTLAQLKAAAEAS